MKLLTLISSIKIWLLNLKI